jgi:ketosteroid isomerase-like protein
MPAFQKTLLGKRNVELYHKAFLSRFSIVEFTRKGIEILDLGSQVLETGIFTMSITLKSTGQQHTLKGKYLNVWEELEDGGLLLITEAWNYDQYYGELHEHFKFDEIPSVHIALLPNVPINSNISFELAARNRLLDATITQHDGNTWSQYYSDDAMLFASYHPLFAGKKAIDDYINMHVKELPVFEELDIRNDRIDDLGVFVIEYASHIASWRNQGASGVSLGKNIRVWRREPDHSLKVFRSIGMYD